MCAMETLTGLVDLNRILPTRLVFCKRDSFCIIPVDRVLRSSAMVVWFELEIQA